MLAPMAGVGNNTAQLWQIEAGMRFRQVGGYALHAIGAGGAPVVLPVSEDARPPVRDQLLHGPPVPTERHGRRPRDRAPRAAARPTPTLFMVGPSETGTAQHLERAKQLLGRAPDRTVGGVRIWELPAAPR